MFFSGKKRISCMQIIGRAALKKKGPKKKKTINGEISRNRIWLNTWKVQSIMYCTFKMIRRCIWPRLVQVAGRNDVSFIRDLFLVGHSEDLPSNIFYLHYIKYQASQLKELYIYIYTFICIFKSKICLNY